MRIPCSWRSWHWIAALMVAVLCLSGARAANVAAGKPAFASYVNENAGLATDNNQNTLWQPTGSPSAGIDWLGVDLGAPTVLKAIRVYWGDVRPTAFTIEAATTVSTDPNAGDFGQGNWTTINTYSGGDLGTAPPPSPYYLDLAANSTAYRYVRVNVTAAPGADWGIRELQVLDAPLPTLSGVAKFGATGVAESIITLAGPAGIRKQEVAANGSFSFGGLDPGTYTLRAVAAGRYAPVSAEVVVAEANVTKDLTYTTTVVNSTSMLPAYSADFIATADDPTDANAAVAPLAMPAEFLPPGNQVWSTNTALPAGATIGENMPSTLKFFMPPTEDNKNNVLSALNVTIPFAPANYTAVYFLQTAIEGNYYTTVTLHYQDGSSEVAKNPAGSTLYGISRGDNVGAPAEAPEAGVPSDDELVAFNLQEMYTASSFTEFRPWNVFIRAITVDSSKVLTAVEFDGIQSGAGATTLSKGYLLGWSADSLAAPAATGSIAGTIKAPNGTPVAGAIVNLGSFRLVTDATGTYKFNSIPAGNWTVSARKLAFYGVATRNVTLTAGQNATGQDIQFAAPAAIMATGIGAPQADLISTDLNYNDFSWTGWMLGREYFPTGLWKPADGGSEPQYSVQAGAPDNLPFLFTDFGDTPIAPGQPGYPVGGTPNVQVLAGATFLAPPVKTTAVYIATVGAEGSNVLSPTLVYTDGTAEPGIISIGDWFGAPTPDEYPYIAMHGRHARDGESNFDPNTNIRLNAIILSVNPNKTLKYIQFGQHRNVGAYPLALAVSWETETPQPAPSDVVVNVKKADNSPAVGAIVTMGPYNTKTDATGAARFIAIPANLPVSLGAYISGVTKQARMDHTVAVGRTIKGGNPDTVTITLPAAAPIFVQLPLAVDHDALAMPDMPGDYKTGRTNDRGFIGEVFPASLSSTTVANVPYRMPIKETFYNNIFRVQGQSIKVVPGNYSSFDFLITGPGIGGNTRITYVTLKYADGTSENVQYGVMDWVKDWANVDASNRELFWRMVNLGAANPFYSAGRRGPANDDAAQVSFPAQIVPVNAAKTLVSIDFLPMLGNIDAHDFEILAATLEANAITGTSGTVTGRIIGQPMGAAQAGPLPITQVILSDGFAAYTDANGVFTIPNAPVGAGSLKVIPYGTGIVSKSFPVNVTAGNVNVGDLNVGAAVNQVSVTFGETDIENGVRLKKPAQLPTGNYNVVGSRTVPVTVAGKSGRQSISEIIRVNNVDVPHARFFLDIDDGWLWRGMQGNNGLAIADRGTPAQTITKLAPTIYVQVEYLDRGTEKFGFEMNRMEGWLYKKVDTDPGLQTIRLTNMWHNPGQEVTKTDTGEWKKVVVTLDPAVNNNAFGAYNGQHLIADFHIVNKVNVDVIHKVTFSTTPDFATPSPAADILRAAGGLLGVTSPSELTALDLDNDGKITVRDAALAARQAQGL